MGSGEGKLVCVTGASGYIASWLTKLLLDRGYTVRATVRSLGDVRKTEHLLALEGAGERLSLFEADLMKDGSFDAAVDGCQGVFHTASPCYMESDDPQAELIDPAVKGTINVLNSCAKSSSTVKRVVFTSSNATLVFDRRSLTQGAVADETWFSDPQLCIEIKQWYSLSKTLAEEVAWKFAKEKGIDLVTTNPGLTIGPLLQPTLNWSSALLASLINSKTYPNAQVTWIHVKDVAHAHLLAFETPSASGRYPLLEGCVHLSQLVSTMREIYPTLQLPNECVDGGLPDTVPISKEKMRSLGMDCCIPLEVGLKETMESLKEKKYITI